MPHVPDDCRPAFHLFYLLLPSLAERQAFLAFLKERGVAAPFHYLPLHLSSMGRALGGRPGDCPVAETVSDRLVRLPLFNDLSDGDQAHVIESIKHSRRPFFVRRRSNALYFRVRWCGPHRPT